MILRAGLGRGHMPVDLVADDLAAGTLVEIKRRAWHLAPLTFMVSRRRGRDLSLYESELIDLLSGVKTVPDRRSSEKAIDAKRSRRKGRAPMA